MPTVSLAQRASDNSEFPIGVEVNRPTCPPLPVPKPPTGFLSAGDGVDFAMARSGSNTTTVTVDCPDGTLPTVSRSEDGEVAIVSCEPIKK